MLRYILCLHTEDGVDSWLPRIDEGSKSYSEHGCWTSDNDEIYYFTSKEEGYKILDLMKPSLEAKYGSDFRVCLKEVTEDQFERNCGYAQGRSDGGNGNHYRVLNSYSSSFIAGYDEGYKDGLRYVKAEAEFHDLFKDQIAAAEKEEAKYRSERASTIPPSSETDRQRDTGKL